MNISMTPDVPRMDFDRFIRKLRENVQSYQGVLFNTRGVNLADFYLCSFPDSHSRQEHNCRCCLSFISRYGGLVKVTDSGNIEPFLWDTSVDYGEFNEVVDAMATAVTFHGNIINVFYEDRPRIGTKWEGGWSHFEVPTPAACISNNILKTPGQVSAGSAENFKMLNRALTVNFSRRVAEQAQSLINSGQLARSELLKGQADWFAGIHHDIASKTKFQRDNIVWKYVANAPVGFCGVSSSPLGALMSDLAEGLDFEAVAARHSHKMDPLMYRRPSTAPGAQNVKRGEEIFRKLGLEDSLARRFARLEDLQLLWKPRKVVKASSGVFRDVATKNQGSSKEFYSTAPATRMTFAKFKRVVMPTAESMTIRAPGNGNYSALITAVHPHAPNILQWSNTVNWYVYPGGSSASMWGLTKGAPIEVTGITLQPNMWANDCPQKGEGVHFILKGCKDTRVAGLALFPEVLKSELNEVRKTIESYSRGKRLEGRATASANGLKFTDSSGDLTISVKSNNIITEYILDRME